MKFYDIEGFLFDMDGLIFDSESLYLEIAEKIVSNLGCNISKKDVEKTIGMNDAGSKKVYLELCGNDFPFETVAKTVDETLLSLSEKNELKLMPGVIELLEYLKENNKKMMLASSSKKAKIIKFLKNSNIYDYFDFIISGEEVTNGKPNPEIFLKAADHMNLNYDKTVVFEDSHNGIRAAYEAGMLGVMIPDLIPSNDEMKQKYYKEFKSLYDVIESFKNNTF